MHLGRGEPNSVLNSHLLPRHQPLFVQLSRVSPCVPNAVTYKRFWELLADFFFSPSTLCLFFHGPSIYNKCFSFSLMAGLAFLFFFLSLKNFFFNLFFIFGCVVSSLLCAGFSLVAVSGDYSSLRCADFSLRWLLFVAEHGL